MKSKLRRFSPGRYEWAMFAVVALATLVRFVLIYNNWPTTNSDEGNMGLVALHVANNGEWPIFFYGLPYLGPVEGYIAAPLFHLFGPSVFTLRLGLVLLFPPFVISMYYLTRLLYTRPFALGIVVLLCLGSKDLISRELKGVGEYPETELFAALIVLIVVYLAISAHQIRRPPLSSPNAIPKGDTGNRVPTPFPPSGERWRTLLYGLLGLIVGIALWVDLLILPFVATGALMLWLFCRSDLKSRSGLSLLAGLIIGLLPLIIYNITLIPNHLDRNSINVLIDLHNAGAGDMSKLHLQSPWLRQLAGTFIVAIPVATGANPLCPLEAIPPFGSTSASLSCSLFQGSWGVGFLVLGIIATIMAVVACCSFRSYRTYLLQCLVGNRGPEQIILNPRLLRELVLQCARLMLLISGGLTLILYVISPSPAVTPWTSARYLTCLIVVFPAILWPLWNGWKRAVVRSIASAQQTEQAQPLEPPKRTTFGRGVWLARIALLCLILVVFVQGTIMTFAEIPLGQGFYHSEGALVNKLLSLGATRIYSEYWTCNRLTFRSQEQIICAALDEQLRPGFDRYAPYRDLVRTAPHPAYIFPASSAQRAVFENTIKERNITVQRIEFKDEFEHYMIYIPASDEGLP